MWHKMCWNSVKITWNKLKRRKCIVLFHNFKVIYLFTDYLFHDVSSIYLILNTLTLHNIHIWTSSHCLTAGWCASWPCFLVYLTILRHSLWSLTALSFLLALLAFGLLTFSWTACRWRCSSTSAPLLWSIWGSSALIRAAVQLLSKEAAVVLVML